MLKILKRFRRRLDEQEVLSVPAPVDDAPPPVAVEPVVPTRRPDDVSLIDWLRLVLGHLQTDERLRLQQRVLNNVRHGDRLPQAVIHAMLSDGGQQDGQWALLLLGVDSIADVERQGRELARSAGIAEVYGQSWHEGRGRTMRDALFDLHTWLLGRGFSLLQMDTGRQEHCMLMATQADAEAAIRLGTALGFKLALPRTGSVPAGGSVR